MYLHNQPVPFILLKGFRWKLNLIYCMKLISENLLFVFQLSSRHLNGSSQSLTFSPECSLNLFIGWLTDPWRIWLLNPSKRNNSQSSLDCLLLLHTTTSGEHCKTGFTKAVCTTDEGAIVGKILILVITTGNDFI